MSKHKRSISIAVVLVISVLVGCSAVAGGLDYVGLRLIVPLGQAPLMLGIDVGTHLSFGWATASLFIAPDGKTLILGSSEVAIGGQASTGVSSIKLTLGMSYFDLSAMFPSIVFGGGISYRFSLSDHFRLAAAGEIIYPLALGPPLFTLGAGWAP